MIYGIIAAIVLAIFLLVGYVLIKRICGRHPAPVTTEGMEWLHQQEVKEIRVLSYDNKVLYGRFVPCENARGTLLLFHGYHSSADRDFGPTMELYHNMGFHLLLADQRAHGRSQGRFLTFGIKERMDVLSWVTYLSLMLGEDHPMFLGGLSMGAATVCMASDMEFPANVRGIIADCGYSSPYEIARYVLQQRVGRLSGFATAFCGFFARLYGGFGLKDWSSVEALHNTKLPVLLFHGTDDKFVPCSMSRQCRDACQGEVTLLEFPGATHCRSYTVDPKRYTKALETFFDNHLKESSPS